MQKWIRDQTQNDESVLEPGATADAAAGFEATDADVGADGPSPNGPGLSRPDAGELVVQGGGERLLSAEQFQRLSDAPAAMVWLANINNLNTRRAYRGDLEAFVAFCGIEAADELRLVTRAHVIAWRGQLEGCGLAPTTIRRRLSAISSFYDYLCNQNAVETNPVAGVKRPAADNNEGKTPALSDEQAKQLLLTPEGDGLKAKRDRAVLATSSNSICRAAR